MDIQVTSSGRNTDSSNYEVGSSRSYGMSVLYTTGSNVISKGVMALVPSILQEVL